MIHYNNCSLPLSPPVPHPLSLFLPPSGPPERRLRPLTSLSLKRKKMAIRKSSKLSQTAMLKQILKRCSSLGKKNGYDDDGLPLDVPKGHFAVFVGEN